MSAAHATQTFIDLLLAVSQAAQHYAAQTREAARSLLCPGGKANGRLLHEHQRALHGLAWTAATAKAIESTAQWAQALQAKRSLRRVDELALAIGLAEYLQQLAAGVPMAASETFRPGELGLQAQAAQLAAHPAVQGLQKAGGTQARHELMAAYSRGDRVSETALDEELDQIREQFRRFTEREITPHAHRWHLSNELVPQAMLDQLAALGVFGICIPAEYGGMGLGKRAMCIVTEELSRGWIATGSLGTRTEIAGELIAHAGTPEQKAHWLPKLASGEVIPTAVFTEPDVGSDMASLKTRASVQANGHWRIDGNKTWATHGSRSDLMTLMARTEPGVAGHAGLSLFLAPKPRGTEANPFPAPGMRGSEIPVLAYRGMREYDIAFDGFEVPADALLGGVRGQGFKQLMNTFEAARIQTAARAVGVAGRAFDLAFRYASDRHQFGRPILEFPRVGDKLALMLAETVMARQLTLAAAAEKEKGQRCDIAAGMAKLLAARTAWHNADNGLQIHGGNGYALEFEISRVLCDARILSIFEGAAEIQAQVIGRGLLE